MIPEPGSALTEKIIGLAIKVHRTLGPGLLESVYNHCLSWELQQHGIQIDREVPLPLHEAQTRTYLRLSNCQIGLLLNFNTVLLKDGIRRFIP
jgi:hypothetical protein